MLNTKYRTEAKNDSEKSNRKQSNIRFVTNERTRTRFASSLNFKGSFSSNISDFLRTFEIKKKNKVKINLLIFVGESVLDLTK